MSTARHHYRDAARGGGHCTITGTQPGGGALYQYRDADRGGGTAPLQGHSQGALYHYRDAGRGGGTGLFQGRGQGAVHHYRDADRGGGRTVTLQGPNGMEELFLFFLRLLTLIISTLMIDKALVRNVPKKYSLQ